jgi:conjugal transfer pilus assembly protein TraE
MNILDYLKSYNGMKRENVFHRISVLFLSFAVLVLAVAAAVRDRTVVITPYTLSSEAWIRSDAGSQSYREAWALFFAHELGNVTPGNIDFVRDRIGQLISPSIYREFMEALNLQALSIKEDRLVLRFEPGSVEYEKATEKIFVSGRFFTRAFNEKETSELRTYEFKIRLSNYAPELIWMDTYNDPPHTQKFLRTRQSRSRHSGE